MASPLDPCRQKPDQFIVAQHAVTRVLFDQRLNAGGGVVANQLLPLCPAEEGHLNRVSIRLAWVAAPPSVPFRVRSRPAALAASNALTSATVMSVICRSPTGAIRRA